MERRTIFPGRVLPILLILPQLLLTIIFFILPAGEAFEESFQATDPFGLNTDFVGFSNFTTLLRDPNYLGTLARTVLFCIAVSVIAMAAGLGLAIFADRKIKGSGFYKVLLIWPYAIAPAIAAVLFVFLMHPQIGLIGRRLNALGFDWNYELHGGQAFALVVMVSAWKQVSYNFIFYLAGLQSIPRSVIEAARLDGARGWHVFRTILFPLLRPTTFFLLVVNLVYSAFDTFGTIYALTDGGPGTSTETLVVKVYRDGVINLDLGGSAAQSVILMILVVALTSLQFRFLGKRNTG
ncbi:MAG TPA: ABC transporter permease subunit [Acetobacteraceae bacterium]|nr:ABC transporter permease subunit [Acetobacteraceae bacterium]